MLHTGVLGSGPIYGKIDDSGIMIASCNEADVELQAWIAAGNVPEPPDPPPPPVEPRPSIEDRLEAVELIVDLGLMEGLL